MPTGLDAAYLSRGRSPKRSYIRGEFTTDPMPRDDAISDAMAVSLFLIVDHAVSLSIILLSCVGLPYNPCHAPSWSLVVSSDSRAEESTTASTTLFNSRTAFNDPIFYLL